MEKGPGKQIQSDIWEFKLAKYYHESDRFIMWLLSYNAMLSKLRRVFDIKTLRSVYYATFDSHTCYASLGAKH